MLTKVLPTSSQSFGDATVLVEFEYEAAEDGGRDSPTYPASITATGAFINGEFVEAQFFKDDTLSAWETAIHEELASDHEDYFDDGDDRRDEAREWAGMEERA